MRTVFLVSGFCAPAAFVPIAAAAPTEIINTASVEFINPQGDPKTTLDSNTVSLGPVIPSSTPSTLTFYKYAPTGLCSNSQGASVAADVINFGGGSNSSGWYFDALGNRVSLAAPVVMDVDTATGTYADKTLNVADLSNGVAVCEAQTFHGGEPVFITLKDLDRNLDPTARDVVRITIRSSVGGTDLEGGTAYVDEVLELYETGDNTGIFSAVIQSTNSAVTPNDGRITIGIDGKISGFYQDPVYVDDKSSYEVLVDPFGILFDARTNQPIDGVKLWIVDNLKPGCSSLTTFTSTTDPRLDPLSASNCLAKVFMDDGVSDHTAAVITGQTVPGNPAVPSGGFRFPLMLPSVPNVSGAYRFIIEAPAGYTIPSSLMPPGGSAPGRSIAIGSHLQPFVILPGPALKIDIPADPWQDILLLQKTASVTEASAGDYVQYRLQLTNNSSSAMLTTTVVDLLPAGMRYQSGSLHVNGVKQPDPAISPNSRTMTITLSPGLDGTAGPGTNIALITYVAQVGAGATVGDAVNTANASGPTGILNGTLNSNVAKFAVRIREFLMSGRFTIIGRVFENDDCSVPFAEQKGVANVRLMMEDGTYVVTDKDGQYHFEGIKPGTHVVQMDTASLPKGWQAISCIDNTRFAGTPYSQFVDARGAALWRADFHVRPIAKLPVLEEPKPEPEEPSLPMGEAGIRLQTLDDVQTTDLTKELAPRSYSFHGRFASAEDVLLPESIKQLEKLASDLKKGKVLRLEVIGHTDSQGLSARAKAKFGDNYGLGLARAKTIADYLISRLGLSEDQVTTQGMGSDKPLASNNTAAGMAKNRRVEVVVFGAMGPTTTKIGERSRRQHRVLVDTGTVAAFNLRTTVMLPANLSYVKGSTLIDGQQAADPEDLDGMLTWRIPAIAPKEKTWEEIQAEAENGGPDEESTELGWQRIITFNTDVVNKVVTTKPAADKEYTFNGRFEPAQAELMDDSVSELEALLETLKQAGTIEKLEIIGHTDSQRLSARAQKRFPDNNALSLARSRTIADFLKVGLGLTDDQITTEGKGPDEPLASNTTPAGMAKNRRVEVRVFTREAAETRLQREPCKDGFVTIKATALVDTEAASNVRLPTVENRLVCEGENGKKGSAVRNNTVSPAPAVASAGMVTAKVGAGTTAAGSAVSITSNNAEIAGVEGAASGSAMPAASTSAINADSNIEQIQEQESNGNDSGRQIVELKPTAPRTVLLQAATKAIVEKAATTTEKTNADDSASSAGGNIDWLAKTTGKLGFLFPEENHNPRSPSLRVVVEHDGSQKIEMLVNGEPASPLNFEGTRRGGVNRSAVSIWRALPLREGPNTIVARVRNKDGLVEDLTRTVYFSNTVVRAELVPEKSRLVADGITRPVIAVRMLDRFGQPVRDGVNGPVTIRAPYMSWQQQEETQRRQLAGLDAFKPQYVVKGDEGIALIELAPTTDSGMAWLDFEFASGINANSQRTQEISAWLEPSAREWVMVGFAEGTVGYNTLKDNTTKDLQAQGVENGTYSDGQISFYAKGSVLGKWILTMAYDSDKVRERDSLLSTIDPNEYYTLYGDSAEQRYDAASQSRLYLKLERGQFYALFGDYETGLSENQLSRYSRTLNGFKAEKAGGTVVFTAYAAETQQNHARDEIRGNGTSGLYRLNQRNIVLNSEQIRIETRDRLHSQTIVNSRALTRHLDYDIDYSAGTIFFKQPVYSQDNSFNPTWIVAEYETLGVANTASNMGGRVGLRLLDGKLSMGVTALHDESGSGATQGQSELVGTDLKYRFAVDSEFRLEMAGTTGDVLGVNREGKAWLAEFEHHNGLYDLLLYVRNQDDQFGVNQQSLSEAGQQKIGMNVTRRLTRELAVQTELFQQVNETTDSTRNAVAAKLQYQDKDATASLGVQLINDSTDNAASGIAGQDFDSQQLVMSASRWFMKRKLELSAQAEVGKSDSADYPNRFVLGAGYAFSDHVKLLAGQEFTDGSDLKTSNSRVGLQVVPWKGARLDSTLNQSQMSEYGPRTFAQFGLNQTLQVNQRWGFDFGIDSAQSIGNPSVRPEVNNSQNTSNILGLGTSRVTAETDDYFAVTSGATYRADIWSWTNRLEYRDGTTEDRYGLTSNFLRQARDGVAFATGFQAFNTKNTTSSGNMVSLDLSWAFRPLGTQWSILDRLEFKYEDADSTVALATPPPGGLFGFNSLVANDAKSRRVINNLSLNRVSREWTGEDRQGNLFRRYERNQWMLYYGSKYVFDTFDGIDYSGYTDMLATEIRHDIRPWLDIGVQASVLNSWSTHTRTYSFGPQIGVSPVRNGWITLGWNLRGFTDRDFDAARYSAQGPYLQLRLKFDQNSLRLNQGTATNSTTGQESVVGATE